jgi:K+-sensing histidine kinase KdpD
MPYDAKDFIEDLRQRLATDYVDDSPNVEWHVAVSDATLNIDPQLLLPALLELFANAFRHERVEGVIVVAARSENGRFVFTLAEPKRDFQHSTEHWGQEPLHALGQGHYGLGLYRTRAIVEAHGGKFEAHHDKDTSSLITTVTLPVTATNG